MDERARRKFLHRIHIGDYLLVDSDIGFAEKQKRVHYEGFVSQINSNNVMLLPQEGDSIVLEQVVVHFREMIDYRIRNGRDDD